MNQGEKRYFKRFISTFERKNKIYLKVYNAIDKQKEYDEKALKKKFEKENFTKHFAVTKNNLYNIILKSLRFYHSNDSPHEKVNKHKSNYIILYHKALHELASKEVQKASKIAEENEFFLEKVLLAHWQNNEALFAELYYNIGNAEKNLDQTLEYIEDLKQYHLSVNICRKIELFQIRYNLRTQKDQEALAEFINNPLFKERTSTFFLVNYHKIVAKISCYSSMKDYEKANIENKKLIDLKLKNPQVHQANPSHLYGDYYNYLYASIRLMPWDKVEPLIAECLKALGDIKTSRFSLFDYDRIIFDLSFFLKLEHFLLVGKIDCIPATLSKVEKEFVHVKDGLGKLYFLHYHYNLAYAHFMIGSYKKAQEYLVELLNSPILKSRKDYLAATHVLNLFTHYELGNFDYLSYQLKNTKQLLQRQEYLYGFEENAIALLSKLHKAKTKKERTLILEDYQIVFDDLAQRTWEIDAFERFNIQYWIHQKLENITTDKKKEMSNL